MMFNLWFRSNSQVRNSSGLVMVVFTLLGVCTSAHAENSALESEYTTSDYYTIGEGAITEVTDWEGILDASKFSGDDGGGWDTRRPIPDWVPNLPPVNSLPPVDTIPGAHTPLGRIASKLELVDIIVDRVISIGTKICKVVSDNRPVVNATGFKTAVLPAGATDWRQLSEWKAPRARKFRITYKNLLGITVVDYTFRISYNFGGTVQGVGQYLANVQVETSDLNVLWGYKFNASAEGADAVNLGREGHPIAGQQVTIKWSVDTSLKHMQSASSYFIRGTGELADLTDRSALY